MGVADAAAAEAARAAAAAAAAEAAGGKGGGAAAAKKKAAGAARGGKASSGQEDDGEGAGRSGPLCDAETLRARCVAEAERSWFKQLPLVPEDDTDDADAAGGGAAGKKKAAAAKDKAAAAKKKGAASGKDKKKGKGGAGGGGGGEDEEDDGRLPVELGCNGLSPFRLPVACVLLEEDVDDRARAAAVAGLATASVDSLEGASTGLGGAGTGGGLAQPSAAESALDRVFADMDAAGAAAHAMTDAAVVAQAGVRPLRAAAALAGVAPSAMAAAAAALPPPPAVIHGAVSGLCAAGGVSGERFRRVPVDFEVREVPSAGTATELLREGEAGPSREEECQALAADTAAAVAAAGGYCPGDGMSYAAAGVATERGRWLAAALVCRGLARDALAREWSVWAEAADPSADEAADGKAGAKGAAAAKKAKAKKAGAKDAAAQEEADGGQPPAKPVAAKHSAEVPWAALNGPSAASWRPLLLPRSPACRLVDCVADVDAAVAGSAGLASLARAATGPLVPGRDHWRIALATALHAAAEGGDAAMCAALVQAGADVNARDSRGRVPAMAAFDCGHAAVAMELCRSGTDLRAVDACVAPASSAAHFAELLAMGCDASQADARGMSAPHWAAGGAVVRSRSGSLRTRLCSFEDPVAVCEALAAAVEAGGDVEAADASGRTPLMTALFEAQPEAAAALLAAGASSSCTDRPRDAAPILGGDASSWPPRIPTASVASAALGACLREACSVTQYIRAAASLLSDLVRSAGSLDAGGSGSVESGPFLPSPQRRGAAVPEQRVDLAPTGGARGVDVNAARPHSGRTALHLAAFNGHAGVVKLLLRAGADVGAEDHRGEAPLMSAVKGNQPAAVKALLLSGAAAPASEVLRPSADGETPLRVAERINVWAWTGLGGDARDAAAAGRGPGAASGAERTASPPQATDASSAALLVEAEPDPLGASESLRAVRAGLGKAPTQAAAAASDQVVLTLLRVAAMAGGAPEGDHLHECFRRGLTYGERAAAAAGGMTRVKVLRDAVLKGTDGFPSLAVRERRSSLGDGPSQTGVKFAV
ncbi:hypothetical protein FNF29_04290 [Cafeteria roenbergensis]|uniref:Uncharacterized protein n=2 Tax=Cafeteria roenbergensis TaxID=33653 RepID=A0A5A8CHC6_CAFRO|nr:hypothetical protein FNF29_04290 [Cafeteria roenbergensis]|eukprot:KAA0151884.1 hypothetical protein FNF29_04290 [Cafeteria roenbergensis]